MPQPFSPRFYARKPSHRPRDIGSACGPSEAVLEIDPCYPLLTTPTKPWCAGAKAPAYFQRFRHDSSHALLQVSSTEKHLPLLKIQLNFYFARNPFRAALDVERVGQQVEGNDPHGISALNGRLGHAKDDT